jgi:OOP family OmpA-OmpF porin
MFKHIIALLVFLVALSQPVQAYDLSNKFGFGVTGGYAIPVFGNPFNTQANADFEFGVHGRYHFNDSLNIEMAITRAEFEHTNVYTDNFNLLGVWRMKGAVNFTPVLGAGLGLVRLKNFTANNLKLSGLARIGVEYGVSQWFSVGLLADYEYISKFLGQMPSDRIHIITPQLALTWYFGGNQNKTYNTANPVVEKSSTSGFVDESQLDSDDDGVKDPEDRCPSTTKGVKVNAIGCALNEKATMEINVEFATGKSTLASKYNVHLKEVAAFLTKYNDVDVQIEGHTDNTGSEAKNIALSQARAEAVMKALVREGIDKKRLTAKGFGPANPLADNNTMEGRQVNRRVVAVLSSR